MPFGKKVKFPLRPTRPEQICWGCDHFCPASDLACGNGSERIPHPIELFGKEWYLSGDWSGLIDEATLPPKATDDEP